MDSRSAADRDPHIGTVRRWYAEHETAPGAQEKTIDPVVYVEKPVAMDAYGIEKIPFTIRVNGGPDRDTMSPIKSPAGLVQYQRPALSFLATLARPACLRRAASRVP